ncbi:hypothetical protein EPUS_05101 [Endocarpon pusillum Z07020]|uniref:BTB domain-containing protein n=1 Tax=Endocarpon pusillum (strain Z07020 / HMAS-L-300199) TaxID=1263415 RepID=U1HNY8_ENDPU|nr:uncharacterized protein EPUS_05101 [Endocarpon pusillum Z07020]ERF70749.1 hypothetical protein EPUS_05101 [Endocarpon pusillum Z07020]
MKREAKRRKLVNEPIAIIKVGSPPQNSHVHKSFLCQASPFFRAALEGSFKESADSVVHLPQDESSTFDRFLGWVYWKEYDVMDLVKGKSNKDYWSVIIHDHIFADKIQVEGFQNHIMNAVIGAYKTLELKPMGLESVLEIYTHTPESCPLRKLALTLYECVTPDWFQTPAALNGLKRVPQFAAELVQKLAGSGRTKKDFRTLRAEDFYDKRDRNADAACGGMERS